MIVKKFLKGFMAAALAVTMAVTPVSSVKAAEVTVTSGASTYTFSQEPVAAFVVTGFNGWRPFTLYCISEGTQIHSNSQIGDGYWRANRIAYDGDEYGFGNMEDTYSESEYNQSWKGGAFRDAYAGRCMYMYGVYHSNDPDVERIIESLALLTSKIHEELDGNIPLIAESLINILAPNYTNSLPSICIQDFALKQKSKECKVFIPRYTSLKSTKIK